jgi:hypothetical protein
MVIYYQAAKPESRIEVIGQAAPLDSHKALDLKLVGHTPAAVPLCGHTGDRAEMRWRARVPEVEKDESPVTISDGPTHQTTKQREQTAFVLKVLPWVLGACIFCFVGLMAAGIYDALVDSPIFARATPTPAFPAGLEVKLVEQDGVPVTVWQVDGNCRVGAALGQVPSGTDARLLEETCYNADRRTTFYRMALANESTGWVKAGDIVLAAEYRPPPPTEIAEASPSDTPRPTPTLAPTPTPAQAPTATPLPPRSPLSTNSWGVRVDRVEMATTLSSPAGDKTVQATGRFALVFLTVTNQGFGARTLHASSVHIKDAEGNRYLNNDLASAYASTADCLDFALDINPGESVCMVTAIDISAQGNYYVLSLQGADDYVLLNVP